MKSNLWTQTFDKVKNNPYDYKNQELFLKEALSILDEVFKHYDKFQLKFHLDKRSVEKAIWMLHLDALDSLRDCIALLEKKKHRIAGKLFRDITEVLDLAILFWWERDKDSPYLEKWYNNEIIQHEEFRKQIKKTKGIPIFEESRCIYKSLSMWTHPTYFVLKNSYSLGGKNAKMLIYDGHSELLILPQTISQYMWKIKDLILYFLDNVKRIGLIDWGELTIFLNKTIRGLKFV